MKVCLRGILLAVSVVLPLFPSDIWCGQSGPTGLDTASIHGLYLDSEFPPAITELETALKEGRLATRSDSLFAFKHLGVMLAAEEQTRERGKHYMVKLLETDPAARITDMYASDRIYAIFATVREEREGFRKAGDQSRAFASAPTEDPVPQADTSTAIPGKPRTGSAKGSGSSPGVPLPPSSRRRALYWAGGVGAVMGVGIGLLIYATGKQGPQRITYDVE